MTSSRLCALGVAVLVLGSGCGVPREGAARRIDPADVPYGLVSQPPERDGQAGGSVADADAPVVYWVSDKDELVPWEAEPSCQDGAESVATTLIAELAAGPGSTASSQGLSTALPSDTRLRIIRLDTDTLVVDLRSGAEIPADRLPLAVAQLVLTLTSAPDISFVELVHGSEALQVPLPNGSLTSEPVSAIDYRSLLATRPSALGSFPGGCGTTGD